MSYKSSGKPNQTDEKTNSEHLNKSPNALKDQGDTPSFMQRIIMKVESESQKPLQILEKTTSEKAEEIKKPLGGRIESVNTQPIDSTTVNTIGHIELFNGATIKTGMEELDKKAGAAGNFTGFKESAEEQKDCLEERKLPHQGYTKENSGSIIREGRQRFVSFGAPTGSRIDVEAESQRNNSGPKKVIYDESEEIMEETTSEVIKSSRIQQSHERPISYLRADEDRSISMSGTTFEGTGHPTIQNCEIQSCNIF